MADARCLHGEPDTAWNGREPLWAIADANHRLFATGAWIDPDDSLAELGADPESPVTEGKRGGATGDRNDRACCQCRRVDLGEGAVEFVGDPNGPGAIANTCRTVSDRR